MFPPSTILSLFTPDIDLWNESNDMESERIKRIFWIDFQLERKNQGFHSADSGDLEINHYNVNVMRIKQQNTIRQRFKVISTT
jgi:hypothetical protein